MNQTPIHPFETYYANQTLPSWFIGVAFSIRQPLHPSIKPDTSAQLGKNDKHCNTHSPSLCDVHGIEHLQGLEWHTTVGHVSMCRCRFGHPCHPALNIKHRSQPAIPQVIMLASMNIGWLCYHNDMWIHCSLIDVYLSLVVVNYHHLLVIKFDDGWRKAHSSSASVNHSLGDHVVRSVWISRSRKEAFNSFGLLDKQQCDVKIRVWWSGMTLRLRIIERREYDVQQTKCTCETFTNTKGEVKVKR